MHSESASNTFPSFAFHGTVSRFLWYQCFLSRRNRCRVLPSSHRSLSIRHHPPLPRPHLLPYHCPQIADSHIMNEILPTLLWILQEVKMESHSYHHSCENPPFL